MTSELLVLVKLSVETIFQDVTSGVAPKKLGLNETLNALAAGYTLVIWRRDRLGKSMTQLVATADQIQNKCAHLRSVHEAIDSSTPSGRVLFHVLAAPPNSSGSPSDSVSLPAEPRQSATDAM